MRNGEVIAVDNPEMLPDPTYIEAIEEPRTKATVMVPKAYVGPMMELCQERRGEFIDMQYQPGDRVVLSYDLPLGEIIHDFYDKLKSRTKCYGGDITRKRKLLEKQKEGKKRMKRVGNVEIPQEAFMAVLQLDE